MKNKDKSTKEALNKLFLHPKKEKSMQPKASEQKRVEKLPLMIKDTSKEPIKHF